VLWLGHDDRADAERRHAEQLASLDQVTGDEDGEGELGELAGLEADRPDAGPDAGAMDRYTDHGQQRKHEQTDAQQPNGVAKALEAPHPTKERQGHHVAEHPDRGPRGLLGGELLVEPGDHHVSQPVQQRGDRQQHGVGPGSESPIGQVGDHEEQEHHTQEGHDVGGDLDGAGEAGERVGTADDQHRQEDQAELGASAT